MIDESRYLMTLMQKCKKKFKNVHLISTYYLLLKLNDRTRKNWTGQCMRGQVQVMWATVIVIGCDRSRRYRKLKDRTEYDPSMTEWYEMN